VPDALLEFDGWHPQVSAIIGATDTTNRWALYDRDPLMRWTVGRATLLGDAAHEMLPSMAQGAAQAIEDAAVLARCLERASRHELVPSLRRYEETRKPRTTRCQEGSRRNGEIYHFADGERQQLNVVRMRLMGAQVVTVERGAKGLKDAIGGNRRASGTRKRTRQEKG